MWLDELRDRWQAALAQRGPCPRCASVRVWFNGVRLRKASVRHGDETVFLPDIPVRQLRCGACVWRWSVAPEAIASPAHYQPCVVGPAVAADVLEEGASEGQVARTHGCARRTLGRWVRRVAQLAGPGVLARHLAHEAQSPVLPFLPPPVKARRSSVRRALGERAVLVLALLDALAGEPAWARPSWAGAGGTARARACPSVGGSAVGKCAG